MVVLRERVVRYFGAVLIIGVLCFCLNYYNFTFSSRVKPGPIILNLCDKNDATKMVLNGIPETVDESPLNTTLPPPKTSIQLQTVKESTGVTTTQIPVHDKVKIKLQVSAEVRANPLFDVFQQRKKYHAFACQHARLIFDRKTSFEDKLELHNAISKGTSLPDEKECIPDISREGSPENHFYDDKHKFHVCLPTKTGSTNWLKMLLSLFMYDGTKDPDEISSNDVYRMSQMPRFQKELGEFVKGRSGRDGYFTMMSVRHPFARLHSAWKDKFRNGHPWFVYIKKKFGDYLDLFETKNMTGEPYEVSFEAFLELAALAQYDTERDRHWKTMQTYCTGCNIEYDFILKQETAMAENDFLIAAMGWHRKHPLLHVPGQYQNYSKTYNAKTDTKPIKVIKTITIEEIGEPYKNISRHVIEQLYINYYPDFVFYNYSIDEIHKASRPVEHAGFPTLREKVRKLMYTKFGYYQKRSDDMTCVGDHEYNCDYGVWRMYVNKTLGGNAQPFGTKKFTQLKSAQTFACDKETVKGITWDKGFYYLRGGATGLRESAKNETTWIKQFASINIV